MLRLCDHCQLLVANRPRQLCHRCYACRSIRRLYRKRTKDFSGRCRHDRRLAMTPTTALPGSPAKLLVFEQRYRRREQLFHPHDA